MKRLPFHTARIATLGLAMLPLLSWGQTPSTSVQAIDAFYLSSARANFDPTMFFTPDARCQVVNYTEDGKSKIISLTQAEFSAQVDTLVKMFDVEQQPVVVLSRYYGHLATAYMSVYTRLIDKKSGDTLRLRSIQAVQMIQQPNWKIASLVIQNEVASFPFSEELWPQELSAELALGIGESNAVDTTATFSLYDPSKVYNVDELQVAPEYPGDPSLYASLLSTFNVTTDGNAQGAPFTVVVEEDGFARLGYVGDLSGAEIERATSFVKSMLIWYPGVKNDASVKTKLVFYLL